VIEFENEIKKRYDCKKLFRDETFSPLKDEVLFKSVKVDQGGYGISWSDELDI
jgi:hypothetical protein